MQIVWHYTIEVCFQGIVAAGQIEPAGLYVEERERLGVWFSRHPTWEPTATKGIVDASTYPASRWATRKEMLELGLARIGVDAAGLSTWVQHRKVSGVSAAMARRLVLSAAERGANPGDWLVHYGPVPRAMWIAVQRWEGAGWRDGPMPTREARDLTSNAVCIT